jgi:hypothetical protein
VLIDELRNTQSGSNAIVMGNSAWRHDALACSFDLVIVCNTAYRQVTNADMVCAMDPATIFEILGDEALPDLACVVTPTNLEKPEFKAVIEQRFITHYAVENRFSIETMTGCMAIGLAGWMGSENVVLCGFSLDGSHVSGEERPAGQAAAEVKAFRTGLNEYGRLCPAGRVSVAVDPAWFLAEKEK